MLKKIVALIVLLVCACAAAFYLTLDSRDGTRRMLHGTVDIRQSTLAFEIPGRIKHLYADEGDSVSEGTVLAVLDTGDLEHQIKIQKAQCEMDEAALATMRNGYRSEELKMARAQVRTLENTLNFARITNERYQNLYKKNSISAQDKDQAFYKMQETSAQLENAKASLELMTNGYREEEHRKAEANLRKCQESLSYLEYKLNEQSVLKAPFSGQIRSRLREIGDMVLSSSGVFELSLVRDKRVRCYATETQLKDVRVGMEVRIINALGEKKPGHIAYISNTAMFTPRTVQTEELRSDLVWEVRVDFQDEDGAMRLGQPVSVEY